MVTLEQLQDGIVLPIDKPRQWTSFQAVNKIKAVVRNTYGLKKFKIGHAGTLDPLATGLLLVCVGKATKTIPTLQDGDKVYSGTMVFGATTPCYDLERPIDNYYPYQHITPELLQQTLPQFTGTILQVPPMFSAVKIDGQRAYEYARRDQQGATASQSRRDQQGATALRSLDDQQGAAASQSLDDQQGAAASQSLDDTSVVIQPKPVNVYSFEITAFRPGGPIDDEPAQQQPTCNSQLTTPNSQLYKNPLGTVPAHLPQADFRIHCGKGTYIRSLARDLGLALGSGAFLSALRREQIGTYSVADALQLDEVEAYLTR